MPEGHSQSAFHYILSVKRKQKIGRETGETLIIPGFFEVKDFIMHSPHAGITFRFAGRTWLRAHFHGLSGTGQLNFTTFM